MARLLSTAVVASLMSACATTASGPAAPGEVKVEYSHPDPLMKIGQDPIAEVMFVDRSQMIANVVTEGVVTDPAIRYGLGLGMAVVGKDGLPGVKIKHQQNRINIKNPIGSDYPTHLKEVIDSAVRKNDALRTGDFQNPFVVRGGHARLIYEELTGHSTTFRLKTSLEVSKKLENHTPWHTSERVKCDAQSSEPLPLEQWAANDYLLVKTELDSFLKACDAKVVAHLPVFLAK